MAEALYKGEKSLGASHIASNLGNYEAAKSAFFVLQVASAELANLQKPDDTELDPTKKKLFMSDKVSDILTLNVTKASVPQFTIETGEYRRGNDVVKFATTPTWEEGSLTVDDIVGVNTKDLLLAWLYLAYNPQTRKGGRMKDYKKTATLKEYTQDYELIRTWDIEGMFVTKVADEPFDRENQDKRKIEVTFVYDRATLSEITYGADLKEDATPT